MISPLAPASFPTLPPVHGVQLASYAAGLRYQKRADLMLAALAPGTSVAGTFTQSLCPSAPVDWCRQILSGEGADRQARAVVCNAGNANAFTGEQGHTAAKLTADVIARALGTEAEQVYLASTGVIGETLDTDALAAALPLLVGELSERDALGPEDWQRAAEAITTTDTYPKGAAEPVVGTGTNVVGIAKGSGMIAPDMATMLAFVFTDLAVTPEALQSALSASVVASYNSITVDSDTSTSDTVLLFATGQGQDRGEVITGPESPHWDAFVAALDSVNLSLAHQIVRDGEGASKFITVTVTGAETDRAAHRIGMAIANSPLVKTAFAAEDANWGRIVMAVGKAGERAERDKLTIRIGDELIAEQGWESPTYSEARATEFMKQPEFVVSVDVGVGNGEATVWTCDLGHGYIEINAGYRS